MLGEEPSWEEPRACGWLQLKERKRRPASVVEAESKELQMA